MSEKTKCRYWVKVPWYKKIPTIPAIIIVLLLGMWLFRWDYNASMVHKNTKYVYKTDRWTGNHWCEVYGGDGWSRNTFNGSETAYLKNGVVASGKQAADIERRRKRATVAWWIAFVSASGYVAYKVLREDDTILTRDTPS